MKKIIFSFCLGLVAFCSFGQNTVINWVNPVQTVTPADTTKLAYYTLNNINYVQASAVFEQLKGVFFQLNPNASDLAAFNSVRTAIMGYIQNPSPTWSINVTVSRAVIQSAYSQYKNSKPRQELVNDLARWDFIDALRAKIVVIETANGITPKNSILSQ
jgi:hypothetical protein